MYKTLTQKTLYWLLIISIIFTMAASLSSEILWMQWSFVPMTIGFLYIVGKYLPLSLLTQRVVLSRFDFQRRVTILVRANILRSLERRHRDQLLSKEITNNCIKICKRNINLTNRYKHDDDHLKSIWNK